MKNKIFKFLCLVFAVVAMLASCDEEAATPGGNGADHNHTFSTEWSFNETDHWHAATCQHGTVKQDAAAHTDADEDGICDVCAYEMGHTHTFSEDWQSDETHHWKSATCTHTSEFGEKALHADMNSDGKCDTCVAHVHVLNTFGFCSICGEEVKPVEENSIASHIMAALARKDNVTEGNISYSYIGEVSDSHRYEYLMGTNGIITKRYDTGRGDNNNYVFASYIKKLSEQAIEGITVTTVNDIVTKCEKLSFRPEHLRGYYYSVSGFAYAYGTEEILLKLYEQAVSDGAKNVVENVDADGRKCTFSYNILTVNTISGGSTPGGEEAGASTGTDSVSYNVHYYEISVEFEYAENHELTFLKIVCNAYSNDAGTNDTGTSYGTNLTYNAQDGTFTLTGTPDKYTFEATQTAGTRGELDMSAGDAYKPAEVEFYTDAACTNKLGDVITVPYGKKLVAYISTTPKEALGMLKISPEKSATNEAGVSTAYGWCMIFGNEITFNHNDTFPVGRYECVLDWGDVKKEFTLVIGENNEEIRGDNVFEVTAEDNNAWQVYEFTATQTCEYTFYLPLGSAAAKFTEFDANDMPIFETVYYDYDNDPAGIDGSASFKVKLTQGETITFCFKFKIKDAVYYIGYDMDLGVN